MKQQAIALTDVKLSALTLGTVKFGRNQSVKYPTGFDLPTDKEITTLLSLARENGMTSLDTAPAYGISEDRIGSLLTDRQSWQIITKAGEAYDSTTDTSKYDYSPKTLEATLEASLKKLKTDYIDCWMLHSDGNDIENLSDEVIHVFQRAKQRGLVRSIGVSTKTVDGGNYALQHFDCIMMAISLENTAEQALFDIAQQLNKSLLMKKIYDSGWALTSGASAQQKQEVMQKTLNSIFQHPAACSAVIGTINPQHLQENIDAYLAISTGSPP